MLVTSVRMRERVWWRKKQNIIVVNTDFKNNSILTEKKIGWICIRKHRERWSQRQREVGKPSKVEEAKTKR